jgi:hypothetical protein
MSKIIERIRAREADARQRQNRILIQRFAEQAQAQEDEHLRRRMEMLREGERIKHEAFVIAFHIALARRAFSL